MNHTKTQKELIMKASYKETLKTIMGLAHKSAKANKSKKLSYRQKLAAAIKLQWHNLKTAEHVARQQDARLHFSKSEFRNYSKTNGVDYATEMRLGAIIGYLDIMELCA